MFHMLDEWEIDFRRLFAVLFIIAGIILSVYSGAVVYDSNLPPRVKSIDVLFIDDGDKVNELYNSIFRMSPNETLLMAFVTIHLFDSTGQARIFISCGGDELIHSLLVAQYGDNSGILYRQIKISVEEKEVAVRFTDSTLLLYIFYEGARGFNDLGVYVS